MIALPSSLPLIKVGSTNLVSCEVEWLRRSLRDAATRAEVPEWFADDVVAGIIAFLRNHYQGTTITLASLYDRIQDTLHSLGLGDLAKELTPTAPPLRICLTDLAHKAGDGYELAFFRLLEQRFAAATDEGIEQVYFYGLRNCVQRLTSLQKWNRRCENLSEEITHFLEHEAQKACAQRPKLSLAIY